MTRVEIRPTNSQIAGGYLVIPQKFIVANDHAIKWHGFTALAFGEAIGDRSLDQCNRLRVKTKGRIEPGQAVSVCVEGDRLKIEAAE